MDGGWRVTRGGRPARADHTVRIILETGDVRAAGVDPAPLEVLDRAHDQDAVAHLGPDRSATTGIRTARRRTWPPTRPARSPRRCWISGCWRGGQRVLQRAVFRVRPTAHQRGQHPARPTARDDPHARCCGPTGYGPTARQPATADRARSYGCTAGRPALPTLRHLFDPPRGVLRRDRGPGYVLVSVVPALAGSEGDGAIFAISSATSASRLSIDVRSIRTAGSRRPGTASTPWVPGRWGRPGRSPRRCPPAAPHRPHAWGRCAPRGRRTMRPTPRPPADQHREAERRHEQAEHQAQPAPMPAATRPCLLCASTTCGWPSASW